MNNSIEKYIYKLIEVYLIDKSLRDKSLLNKLNNSMYSYCFIKKIII